MAKQIFRERAIKAYVDPDTRGPLLPLHPPAVTRLLGAIAALTLAALVVAAFLRVQVVANGPGVVRPVGGVAVVRAPATGTVRRLGVAVGESVRRGAVLLDLGGPVVAHVDGTVDALLVRDGEFVTAGTAVAKIVPGGARIGYLAIPARFRSDLGVGQPVRLSLDEYPATEMGFGHGHILRISEDLLTPEVAAAQLGGVEMSGSANVLVEISLDELPPRAEGSFHNGMVFQGVVTTHSERALTLLFPPLARVLD